MELAASDDENQKYYKDITINGISSKAYIDFGSACTIIILKEVERLKLNVDFNDITVLCGYGNGVTRSVGSTTFRLAVDGIEVEIKAVVVDNKEQNIPIIIGRTFTELENVSVFKDNNKLSFIWNDINPIQPELKRNKKIVLRSSEITIIPANYMKYVQVITDGYEGDIFIESSVRPQEGRESCVPQSVVNAGKDFQTIVPIMNLSYKDIVVKKGEVVARGWPCEKEPEKLENVLNIKPKVLTEIKFEDITVGNINENEKKELFEVLMEYRDCIAQTAEEMGCAKSVEMKIRLSDDEPFYCRPYRLSGVDQEVTDKIVKEHLEHGIVRESDSNYASPIVLVKKKNGEIRMCVDYRRLNSITVRDNYPLPRIDDQIDRLQGGKYFTSLDLWSGYHQIPLDEGSKYLSSFVTPSGQYEYNRMPFGLCNAPRTFQRYMNKILKPVRDIAAVYLDDVLLHAKNALEALNGLKRILKIFRDEGLTLNLKKCSFLMTNVTFLGFEIEEGTIKPGNAKITAVEKFTPPRTVRQVRQFLGLTGYFRHFVKNYGVIARPLTNLIRKAVKWQWTEKEEQAFTELKAILVEKPVLALFNPEAKTEVHTDASSLGLAGILLQIQEDTRLHPVAYFSRQTTDPESRLHSYELETLAVVESLRKFRPYLIGVQFTVVTDCNALKATKDKKELTPKIARWWLILQEFTFDVKYRPGNRMRHVDALSRNPATNDTTVMRITEADWVLAGQLTDAKIGEIRRVLSQLPTTDYERDIYKNYALRDGRVYRITARGVQWVVPRGMRQQVVRAAHDDMGHFALEKTLYRLCEHYWFPRMREYVQKYISCCIKCLFNKRVSGRKEGFLHPIPKDPEPMRVVHIDHLGPFPQSKKKNCYLIVIVDAFTKFTFLRAVRSTKTFFVIQCLKDIFAMFGAPKMIISDQGSAFTSKLFQSFCNQNIIKHVKNAVATPRANGQVERLNRSIVAALMTSILEEELWDQHVRDVQFAINNVPNKSTNKTPSELLYGYKPRGGGDTLLSDEIKTTSDLIIDLTAERERASQQIKKSQDMQKKQFDKKRKKARRYKEGDIVVIVKNEPASNVSRKLQAPYNGPMVIKRVLPNDRYVVHDVEGTHRMMKKGSYERVVAVDRIKPWSIPGGCSDETGSESGEDGVVLSDPDESPEPGPAQ